MGRKKKGMLMTSLSRRETLPISEDKSVGCMSGIFHFLSRHHHNHSRKRLPSAGRKKQQQPEQRTATPQGKGEETVRLRRAISPEKTFEIRRHSCEVQRSPRIPSEIRRSSSVELSLDSPRRPTSLVIRLMGLDEIPVSSPDSPAAAAAEKRRRILGSLEKCDEDLKSLKRIIDAVLVGDKRSKKEEGNVVRDVEDGDSSIETVKSVDSSRSIGEQPSPVSVLDSVSSPTYRAKRMKKEKQKESQIAPIPLRATIEPSRVCIKGNCDKNKQSNKQSDPSIFHQLTIERLPPTPKRKDSKLREEAGWSKRLTEGDQQQRRRRECRRSNALVESVGEVWEDGVWEQRWEFGRVAVGLERGIFGDLVDEFVREMLGKGLISQGICRKRLCF